MTHAHPTTDDSRTQKDRHMNGINLIRKTALAVAAASFGCIWAPLAQALEFEPGHGVELRVDSKLTAGAAWRMATPHGDWLVRHRYATPRSLVAYCTGATGRHAGHARHAAAGFAQVARRQPGGFLEVPRCRVLQGFAVRERAAGEMLRPQLGDPTGSHGGGAAETHRTGLRTSA